MKSKFAIITSGGGMKCTWEVGVLLCLAEKFGITTPDILIAASGSSGTGSYYVAEQYASMRNIRGNLLSVKSMVSFRRFWKIIDIDYLIDDICRKQDPLDVEKVYASRTHYLIPALDTKTAEIQYFSNKDNIDILKAMKASMAMPMAFKMHPHIVVKGKSCCDSVVTSHTDAHIAKAVALGAKKILILDVHKGKPTAALSYLFDFWAICHAWLFRKNYFNLIRNTCRYKTPEGIEIFVFRRRRNIAVKTMLDNQTDHLKRSIDRGYQETLANKKLAEFLAS